MWLGFGDGGSIVWRRFCRGEFGSSPPGLGELPDGSYPASKDPVSLTVDSNLQLKEACNGRNSDSNPGTELETVRKGDEALVRCIGKIISSSAGYRAQSAA